MKENNTPIIEIDRLKLRKFNNDDLDDMVQLYSDKKVNEFLPWFPHESREETKRYLDDIVLKEYEKQVAYCYAIELKENCKMVGYVVVHDIDVKTGCGELGYALMKEYWGKGIIVESCKAIIERLKQDGFKYVVATHDIKNLQSGRVLQKLGMCYKYSYIEQVQPKNIAVTFRMYQLDFDKKERTHLAFWEQNPEHFIEKIW